MIKLCRSPYQLELCQVWNLYHHHIVLSQEPEGWVCLKKRVSVNKGAEWTQIAGASWSGEFVTDTLAHAKMKRTNPIRFSWLLPHTNRPKLLNKYKDLKCYSFYLFHKTETSPRIREAQLICVLFVERKAFKQHS
jgi:hypothetical protein